MSKPILTFAVIADSHYQVPGAKEQSAYLSDAHHNDRNTQVVEAINRSNAAFVIHAGDVPHPVPGLKSHLIALDIAKSTYNGLTVPLHVVPGNHDVGDKPNAWKVASSTDDTKHAVFESYWGASYRAFSQCGIRFILLDTPVINSGNQREVAQQAWLVEQLEAARAANERIFTFVHYPPFLSHADEPEHYDNIAEPGRSALLGTLSEYGAEAIFCGHVHLFFYNRYKEIPIYVLPATSFVRPEYSELCSVSPGDEYGRNDTDKLGFFFVHCFENGHKIEPIRTHGAIDPSLISPDLRGGVAPPTQSPLVASLSHDISHLHDIPCGNLDAFRRKGARNDLVLQAMLELGITQIRIPAGDLAQPRSLCRFRELSKLGFRFIPFSGGKETRQHHALVIEATDIVEQWEVVTIDGRLPKGLTLEDSTPQVVLTVFGNRARQTDTTVKPAYFSHFPPIGFLPDDPDISSALASAPAQSSFCVRLHHKKDLWTEVQKTADRAREFGTTANALLELPRDGEGTCIDDERLVATRLGIAYLAAISFKDVKVIIDTFVDHDRGYYPRFGVIDRRGNPRAGFKLLHHLIRLVPPGTQVQRLSTRCFKTETGIVVFSPNETLPVGVGEGDQAIDLLTGQEMTCIWEKNTALTVSPPAILLR